MNILLINKYGIKLFKYLNLTLSNFLPLTINTTAKIEFPNEFLFKSNPYHYLDPFKQSLKILGPEKLRKKVLKGNFPYQSTGLENLDIDLSSNGSKELILGYMDQLILNNETQWQDSIDSLNSSLNIDDDTLKVIKEEQLRKNLLLDDTLTQTSSIDLSLGTYGDAGINALQQLGKSFTGTTFNLGNDFQNVDVEKIIGSTASGILTGINSIKNLNLINRTAKQLGSLDGLKNAKAGNIGALAGAAAGIVDSFLGDKTEYAGDQGQLTLTLDTVYDGISDAAMSFGPVGMLIGGAMKGADLLGDVFNKFGGGTDGMTTQDAILGSSFFSWNVGLINGFGGNTTDTISKDYQAFDLVGSSYTGTGSMVDDALTKSGKKYGLFSKNAYNKAQSLINESKRLQGIMSGIADEAYDRFAIRNSMTGINAERRNTALNGGYRQANVRIGREGMLLDLARNIINKANTHFIDEIDIPNIFIEELEIPGIESFKLGGSLINEIFIEELLIPTFVEELSIEIFKDGGKTSENEEIIWNEDPIEYSLQRFPILKNLPTINLQYDPNFYPNEIGNYGNLEYMEAKHDNLPYYRNYRKLKNFRGLSVIVYNDEVNNEDIALDWLSHGLREYDSKWQEYLQRLAEDPTWKEQIFDELFGQFLWDKEIDLRQYRKLSKSLKQKLEKEFNNNEIDREAFNSVLDGLIRGILVRRDTENSESYGPENLREKLQNTEIWKEIETYLNGNIEQYKLGGKVNVIPDGALHARLHHMENDENITKKGIPVVSETENGIEQQAEIELNEIIFRLEVTKRLEGLQKEYYNDNTSLKRKDELAIEAGKILTYEILYNTQDNTNLINEIK